MTDEEFTEKATKILHHVLGKDEAVRNVAAGRLAALVAACGKPITSFTLTTGDKPDNRSPQERKAFSALEMYFKHYEGWVPEERDEYLFHVFAGIYAVLNNLDVRETAARFDKFRDAINAKADEGLDLDAALSPGTSLDQPRSKLGKIAEWWQINGENVLMYPVIAMIGPLLLAVEFWPVSIPLVLFTLWWAWNPISEFVVNVFWFIVNSRPR